MFKKPQQAVGVDIGSHAVKAVQILRSGDSLIVEQARKVEVDLEKYAVDPLVALSTATRDAVANCDLAGAIVVASLSGHSVVTRYLKLQKMPKEELEGAIQIEAGQSIPYDLSEVTVNAEKLTEVSENDQTLVKVLVVAARDEVIKARLEVLNMAGIAPHILGVDTLALADACELTDELREDETVAIINVGGSAVSIHFCRDGVSSFMREIGWGGGEVATAIQRAFRVEAKTAQRIQEGLEEPPSTTSESGEQISMEAAVRSPIVRLVGEIRRSFDYYEQQLYEKSVDRIILTGGLAPCSPVRDVMSRELGIENIEIANPQKGRIQVPEENASAVSDLLAHPARFMVAIGLAGRGAMAL
ncbi:MAG: type IV pilus assembly protein PilM [Candidatus Hydrogenedentes bacterium]|nr:type IV pilus assembly protein PilM [Candidatus Hydrogenedentota bacterium]